MLGITSSTANKIPLKIKAQTLPKVGNPPVGQISDLQALSQIKTLGDPDLSNQTWTFTFCESAENHVGMQMIGNKAPQGFSLEDLSATQKLADSKGLKTELVDLYKNLPVANQDPTLQAQVLIIREAWKLFFTEDEYKHFLQETKDSEKIVDKKAWMKGRVVNKKARYNLCYADFSQQPNYEEKKGTVVNFQDVPYLNRIRQNLGSICGQKGNNLFAEMNYYYDSNVAGIGPHGDSERRLVVGLRVGASMDLQYHWFHEGKPIGELEILNLNGGDLYIMSDKAVGQDWKKRKIPTLRHAAGAKKYTTFAEKKK